MTYKEKNFWVKQINVVKLQLFQVQKEIIESRTDRLTQNQLRDIISVLRELKKKIK